MSELSNLKFPMKFYDRGEVVELLIFCDSSKSLYSFSCFVSAVVNGEIQTNLIFSKNKNAPTSGKSLPTLELMSAFLAFKCMPTILESINAKISAINIFLDSQVALSWLINEKCKSKNIFASNRLKDVAKFKKDLLEKYDVQCSFKYMPTFKYIPNTFKYILLLTWLLEVYLWLSLRTKWMYGYMGRSSCERYR